MNSQSPMSHPLQCVVLFDIDGTLLTGPAAGQSAGVRAMEKSASAITGIDGLHRRVAFAGRTDRQIARDLLCAGGHSCPSSQMIARLLDTYIELLGRDICSRPYRALGGAREAVSALRSHEAIVGLGTGNIRRGAEVKLRSAAIDDLFDISRGGYGDDADERADVIHIGARRCDPSATLTVVVVGDTPLDIQAARDVGGVSVGVPTGHYDLASLRDAGADAVVPQLDASLVAVVARLLVACKGERQDRGTEPTTA